MYMNNTGEDALPLTGYNCTRATIYIRNVIL